MIRKLLALLAGLVGLVFCISNVFAAQAFKVTIYNPNPYDLTDYQVRIDLSNYTSSPTYLKVVDSNGNVLPFCYEQPNGECSSTKPTAIIWVKVNLTSNSNTIIYILPSDINYATTGDNVFDLYADFNEVFGYEYCHGDGTCYYGDSEYYIVYPPVLNYNYTHGISTPKAITRPFILEINLSHIYVPPSGTCIGVSAFFGFFSNIGGEPGEGYLLCFDEHDTMYLYKFDSFGNYYLLGVEYARQYINWYKPNYFKFIFSQSSVIAIVNNKLQIEASDTSYMAFHHFGSFLYVPKKISPGWSFSTPIDWIRIRKYADQDPVITIQPSISVDIINKKDKSFVSLINVTVNITNPYLGTINTTIYFLLNDTVVHSENITLRRKEWDATIKIYNPNSYDLTDYQVRVDLSNYLPQATYLKVCADPQCNQLLNFCYEQDNGECNTSLSKVIWVKVPNIPANGNTVIYIKTTNTNYAKNGDQVFDFYDDFNDGVVDTSKWTIITSGGASVTEENGYLKLDMSVANANKQAIAEANFNVSSSVIIEDRQNIIYDSFYTWSNGICLFYNSGNFIIYAQWGQSDFNNPPQGDFGIVEKIGGLAVRYSNGDYARGVWYRFKAIYKQDLRKLYVYDDSGNLLEEITGSTTHLTNTFKLRLYAERCYAPDPYSIERGILAVDWIRVRKYADQEPSVTIEVHSNEVSTISYTYTITDEGTYSISVKVYDPIIGENITDYFTITVNLYDLSIIDSPKVCYVSPCNFTIQARCGLIHQSNPMKVQEFLNNQVFDIPCDNQTYIITIQEDVSGLHGSTNVNVDVKAFSPVDGYTTPVRTSSFTIDLIDLYDLITPPSIVCYTHPCDITVQYRCGVLGYVGRIGSTGAINNATMICDNTTRTAVLSIATVDKHDTYWNETVVIYSVIDNSTIVEQSNVSAYADLFDIISVPSSVECKTHPCEIDNVQVRCGVLNDIAEVAGADEFNRTSIHCDNSTHIISVWISTIDKHGQTFSEPVYIYYNGVAKESATVSSVSVDLYDLSVPPSIECYVSPCNITITARCGILTSTKPLKIKEWLNNQIYDVPCDNVVHTVNIQEDVTTYHGYSNLDVLIQAFSPADNYQQVVESGTVTITKVDLYDLFNLTLSLVNIYNNTKYGHNITVKAYVRCGVLGNTTQLWIKKDESNYEVITVACDNSTKEYSATFTPTSEGNKTVDAILFDVFGSQVESKSDWYMADLYPPTLILDYDVTPENYLVTRLIVEDTISPVAYCTVILNDEKVVDNQPLEVGREYKWYKQLEYGYNNLTVDCEDLAFHGVSKYRLISVAPNLIKTLEWDFPHEYYVGERAKVTGKFTVINVGEAPIVQPLVESIPFTYGENLKIYIEGTNEVVFEADKWTGPISITIKDLPAGERRTYIIEYEIPTVEEVSKKEYFIIEGGTKYNVYHVVLRSKAPIVLERVYYKTFVANCSDISKVTVDDKPTTFTCIGRLLKVYLGSFTPSETKVMKIFSKGPLKVPFRPIEMPKEIRNIIDMIIEYGKRFIGYVMAGVQYLWNLINKVLESLLSAYS